MNFYSELLDTNISICKTKDGFVAAAELDYVKYTSEPICEGLISNITIAQFDKLHSKFKPEVSFVDQKINVVYDIEFLGAKITFILHKENLTSEKEMLIKYKKHSEIISRLEDKIQSMFNKIQSMQEAKDISSTVHVVKLIYHVKKGMYFNVPDLISDKFYKMMHTFYNCPIYQHDPTSVPWQNKYDSIDELFANSDDLYIDQRRLDNGKVYPKYWTDLISPLKSSFLPGMVISILEPVHMNSLTGFKDQCAKKCDKYNVKEICVARIHISQPFNTNYKLYGTGEAGEKKYYIDMIENGHNLPCKLQVPMYNINTKLMENSIVVWNVQNEPGDNC